MIDTPDNQWEPEDDPENPENQGSNPDNPEDFTELSLGEFLNEIMRTPEQDPNSHLETLTIAQEALRESKAFTVIVDGPEGTQSITSTVNLSAPEESEFNQMVQETLENPKTPISITRAIRETNRLENLYGLDLSGIKVHLMEGL